MAEAPYDGWVVHGFPKKGKKPGLLHFVVLSTFSLAALSLGRVPACQASEGDPWFGQDKALHFSATALLACDGYATAAVFSKREGVRLAAGAGVAIAAGAAKEVYDKYAGGDASMRDLTWDVVGAATGSIVSSFASWLIDRNLF